MKKGKFSEEEILFLKENYSKYDIDTLCFMMDRTLDSIRCKASSLGLKYKDYYNEMKQKLQNNNYDLLSDKYISAKTKYKIKCLKHNEIKEATYSDIMENKFRCKFCKSELIRNALITDIYTVRLEFIKHNLIPKFVDEDYTSNKKPLKYLCPIHNDDYQYISYDSLKRSKFGCINCAAEYRGSLFKGDKCYNWKGGLRSEKQKIRDSIEYTKWRRKILKKDNYTCQCCGARNGNGKTIKLRVHHKENFASNPELRLDINNGITLCDNCHDSKIIGSFHNIYGTHYNTTEQLCEYIILNKELQSESQKDSLLLCSND